LSFDPTKTRTEEGVASPKRSFRDLEQLIESFWQEGTRTAGNRLVKFLLREKHNWSMFANHRTLYQVTEKMLRESR
jgi:hypothetical protein